MSVYDVDNPESTGFMLNWTLTLFGEQDPTFEGTPIHLSTGIHKDEEHELPVSTTSTQTTISDNTPSRPTPIKLSKSKATTTDTTSSTTTTTSTTSTTSTFTITSAATTTNEASSTKENPENTPSIQNDQVENETYAETKNDGYLTIVYSVVGSVAIFVVASAIFFYKKKGWKSSTNETFERRPDGYEFDVLQPLTELDEEESDDEVDRLVRNH